VLNNEGTFNVTAGGDFAHNFFNAAHAINNSGTWNVSGAGTTSYVSGIAFHNTGTVNVTSGTFALHGGGSGAMEGSFAVSSGATLEFANDFTLSAISTVSGAGVVKFSGGTVEIEGTYANPDILVSGGTANFNGIVLMATEKITLNSGTLGGYGMIDAAGDLDWTGGTMGGTGWTTVRGSGSTISGSETKSLERLLTNTGR
jgi:hypothetical protein